MADNVNWNGWVTPDLARNPGLATDAYNSKNPVNAAPALSLAAKGVAVSDGINDSIEGTGSQSFWAKIGAGTLNALSWLGKPLKEIQKDYKFVHSVYTNHGFLAGFTATAGIAAGGIAGFATGGPAGAAAGADIAAIGERKLLGNIFTDSYKNSEDENYKVSPGRDFSNALSKATSAIGWQAATKAFQDTSHGIGKLISGAGDIAFDINTDPIIAVSKYAQLMKAGKLFKTGTTEIKYPLLNTVPGVKNFLLSRTGVALSSDQMDLVRSSAGNYFGVGAQYNRALEDMANTAKAAQEAGKPSLAAGAIAVKYPQLGTEAAGRIGSMTNPDEIHNFLKTSLYFGEMQKSLAGQAILPSRTLLRAAVGDSKVVDAIRNASIPKFVLDEAGQRIKNPEWSALSPSQRAGNIYKTFTGYMPYSVDKETGQLYRNKFRWDANDSALNVYKIARFGMGDAAAKELAGKYAEAIVAGGTGDMGLARAIKNQAIFETFKALGLPDKSKFVQSVWEDINKIDEPIISNQVYGVKPGTGEALGQYKDTITGTPKTGAISKDQTSEFFGIPDFIKVKRAMRDAGMFSKHVGELDDFVSKAYTDSIFKPLALATAGFGLRIAASELLPTFARYGLLNTIQSKIAASAAKAEFKVSDGDMTHIAPAVLTGLGAGDGITADALQNGFPTFQNAKSLRLKLASKLLPDQQLHVATQLVMRHKGYLMPDAVVTGAGMDADVAYQSGVSAHIYQQLNSNHPLFKEDKVYTTLTTTDPHYVPRLTINLSKAANETMHQNVAQDILKYQSDFEKSFKRPGELVPVNPKLTTGEFYDTPEYLDLRAKLVNSEYNRMMQSINGSYEPYDAERKVITRWKNGDIRQFAEDRVDKTLGMLIGKDGTFHTEWAQNMANKTATDVNTIADLAKSNPGSMPAAVAGPLLTPYVPAKNLINNVVNLGFKKVIDPIVNNLSREPLYVMHVGDAYARMLPQIAKGYLTDGQAMRIAETQATFSMLPQIHNVALRSQFAQLARNFLPFYFAQEQALRRAFNTLKDTSIANPLFSKGMRFYQLSEHAMSDPTFMSTDENGNKFINFPVIGALGTGLQNALSAFGVPIVSGLPITVKGSTVSLKSVLPELQTPGVTPIAAISANLLADFFPATKPIVKGTVGQIAFQKGILDTLVPATWAKTALSALTPIDLQGQMNGALASALATAYYHNQVPGPDASAYDRQAFIDRIKNNARSILLIKTFLNLTSPLAPQVKQEDAGFREEFWKLVKKHNNNFGDALQEFMTEHGTRAVSYTVGKTEAAVRGLKVPYIQNTVDYIKNNGAMFDPKSGVSTGAFFLIPQDNSKNESDRTVYNELMSMHLRSQRSPDELLKQFYISQGYAAISPLIKEHVATLAQVQNIPFLRQQEQNRWSGVIDKMKNMYPIWYSDYTNPDRRTDAQLAVNQLNKIFSSKNPPQHEQALMVKDLLDKYNQYQAQAAQFNMMNIRGGAAQINKQDWEDYLMTRAEQEPRLNSVIYSVFLKLG